MLVNLIKRVGKLDISTIETGETIAPKNEIPPIIQVLKAQSNRERVAIVYGYADRGGQAVSVLFYSARAGSSLSV